MHPTLEALRLQTRRTFLSGAVGSAALASLLNESARTAEPKPTATAKRIIYLFQSGGPSHLDLFDHKPGLAKRFAENLPESVRNGQRLTGMTATQDTFPVAPSKYKFRQHGKSGAWLSDLLPHTAGVADDLCFIKSLHTEAINHDPAITFCQTGAQLAGRPSFGSWVSYGLGSENKDLPAFVVLISQGSGNPTDQPLYDRLWGSGFLPSRYQGVKFRSQGDPVLFLSNPDGVERRRPAQVARRPRQVERAEAGHDRRPGDRDADRAVRDGVPDADQRAGPHRPVERAGVHVQALRRGREEARHVRGELPARAPAGRARRAVRAALPPRVGPARQPAQADRGAVRRHRPARPRRSSPT